VQRAADIVGEQHAAGDADRPEDGAIGLRLSGRLVLWSGRPELLLEAQDLATGQVAWSVQIFAPEAKFPAAIDRGIDDFDATISRQ